MPNSKHDRLAKQVQELRISFDMALSNKRKYPRAEFEAFCIGAGGYIEALGRGPAHSSRSRQCDQRATGVSRGRTEASARGSSL